MRLSTPQAFTPLRTNCSPQTEGHLAEAGPGTAGIYLPPNEQHPAAALPIYRKSNHGVYVSVGTERSFIEAALTSAEGLYVIDYDLLAVRFAKVNRALLAASTNRADYAALRLTAAQHVWRQRSQHLTGEDKETLASPESWAFWDKKIRKSRNPAPACFTASSLCHRRTGALPNFHNHWIETTLSYVEYSGSLPCSTPVVCGLSGDFSHRIC